METPLCGRFLIARPSGPKSRCSGNWTEARYNSFIKNTLRSSTRKWGPVQSCKKSANIRRGVYECAECKKHVGPTILVTEKGRRRRVGNIFVDHINPVVPLSGFTTWDECIEAMFSEEENLQLLCLSCHKTKSGEEASERSGSKAVARNHPREYKSWRSMRARCLQPNNHNYQRYGGRGIKIEPRWVESFWNFLDDMGPRPDLTTLNRVNNDGDYCKDNCNWASYIDQANNKSNNHTITYREETLTLTQWGEKLGILPSTLSNRVSSGWPIEEILGIKSHKIVRKRKGEANG